MRRAHPSLPLGGAHREVFPLIVLCPRFHKSRDHSAVSAALLSPAVRNRPCRSKTSKKRAWQETNPASWEHTQHLTSHRSVRFSRSRCLLQISQARPTVKLPARILLQTRALRLGVRSAAQRDEKGPATRSYNTLTAPRPSLPSERKASPSQSGASKPSIMEHARGPSVFPK